MFCSARGEQIQPHFSIGPIAKRPILLPQRHHYRPFWYRTFSDSPKTEVGKDQALGRP
jgi:hypothetical protein